MKHTIQNGFVAFLFIFILSAFTAGYSQVSFSGALDGVSTYVWRGIKANNGPAIQADASFSYGIFSLGAWASSVNFGDDVEVETDPYLAFALPTGDFSTTLGATVYMFDFRTFNQYADAEFELFAQFAYGFLGLDGYFVPSQNSTKEDAIRSLYWLELSAAASWMGADLAAVIAYGTYSSRWLPEGPTKDPEALLVLTAAKPVSDEFSVFWTLSFDAFNSGFENIFYFGGSYAF
jgi:uncharacterized protein (TIGR02001 family)